METLDLEEIKRKAREKVVARHAEEEPEEKPAGPKKPAPSKYAHDLGQKEHKHAEKDVPGWGKSLGALAGLAAGAVAAYATGAAVIPMGLMLLGGGVAGHLAGKHIVDPNLSKTVSDSIDTVKKPLGGALAMVGDAFGMFGKPLVAIAAGAVACAAAVAAPAVIPFAPMTAGLMAGGVALAAASGKDNGGWWKGAALGMALAAIPALVGGGIIGNSIQLAAQPGASDLLQSAVSFFNEMPVAAKMTAVGATLLSAGAAVGATLGGTVSKVLKLGHTLLHNSPFDLLDNAEHGIKNALAPAPKIVASDTRAPEKKPHDRDDHDDRGSGGPGGGGAGGSADTWASRVGRKGKTAVERVADRGDIERE